MKFTPEVLLGAPQLSAGVPNSTGEVALYTQRSYDFEKHCYNRALRLLNTNHGTSVDFIENDDDITGINWLDDNNFVFLQSSTVGTTSIRVGHITQPKGGPKLRPEAQIYEAGIIDAPVTDSKVTKIPSGVNQFALVFAAEAAQDGSLFNPQKAKELRSSGRLYSNLYARHWDRYEGREKNALFYARLSKDQDQGSEKYRLSTIINILKDTGLECPIPPFGGLDHFDVDPARIIFVAKDPNLDPSLNTKCNVYITTTDASNETTSGPEMVSIPESAGACTSPVLSPDGSMAAFSSMKNNGYESDLNQIFLVALRGGPPLARRIHPTTDTQSFDHSISPLSLCFTKDSKSLIAMAEFRGKTRLFLYSLIVAGDLSVAANLRMLTRHGSVSHAVPLANGGVFVTGSTLNVNSFFALVDANSSAEDLMLRIPSHSYLDTKFGLQDHQISEIWTPASNPNFKRGIHSIVVRPSTFDSSKKYPVAYIIHGGPQACWKHSWNLRWNLAVFAEQGYLVVAPNITGSTGYGQEFTDAIIANYGGDPYQDIVNCLDWVGGNLTGADNDRAVALGHSFGGYMINWIQGHELGRKFKALVCHNGIFSMTGLLSTDELFAQFNDHGGIPWAHTPPGTAKDGCRKAVQGQQNFPSTTLSHWRRWDPSEHLSNWATPQLLVANAKDYRLCISEGLAAFNVLQARGIESQFLTFPDENHWVSKPENLLVWYKVVLNWVNKHVGLPPVSADDPESDAFWGGVKN